MIYTVTVLSEHARRFLKPGCNAAVHSVYRKTVNLCADGRLLAIQAKDSPVSPLSLICDMSAGEMLSLPVSAGCPADITETSIRIRRGNTLSVFDFSSAVIEKSSIKKALSHEQAFLLKERILRVLSETDVGGFRDIFSDPQRTASSMVLNAASRRLTEAEALFQTGRWTACAQTLAGLIGLGGGLTPSGDDFLCGLLSGFALYGRENHPLYQHLTRELSLHLNDTNDISRAFLLCALEQSYSTAVISLCDTPPSEEIAGTFLAIGHSSGIDTLCGIRFILNLLLPPKQT